MRIVFGDALVGKKSKEHTHIVLLKADAVELAELILKYADTAKRG
jgi:hypothetical protein